ncbi:MAG: hypothetical protein ACKVE4_00845 [Dissulfuribacterales bacterium]
MILKPKQQHLGDKIAALLQDEIVFGDSVLDYIDSTFLTPSAENFSQILADPNSCESQTVYELLFFPDEQFQKQLELILKSQTYDDEDVENIITYLEQRNIQTTLTFPDKRGDLKINIPDSTIRPFMRRLNITKHIDLRISKTLTRCIPNLSDIHQIRVMLRNCRFEFSDPICDFLCQGIEKIYPKSEYFFAALTFILNFLDHSDPAMDIYLQLMWKKRGCLQMIQQTEKNEKALMKSSVEQLLLQGHRVPAVNIADARKQITLIDHICISIFGQTEFVGIDDPEEMPIDPGSFNYP